MRHKMIDGVVDTITSFSKGWVPAYAVENLPLLAAISEYSTLNFDLPRQVGKTTAFIRLMKSEIECKKILFVAHNRAAAEQIKKEVGVFPRNDIVFAAKGQSIENALRGTRGWFDYVLFDEVRQERRNSIMQELFSVGYLHKNTKVISMGTPLTRTLS